MGTNFPSGLLSRGVPVEALGGGGGIATLTELGKTYYIDPVFGSASATGREPGKAFVNIQNALDVLSHYDTIKLLPGDHTGNYTTPINADAAFVKVQGLMAGRTFPAAWMGATASGSPIWDVRARGWEFSGIELDNPTGAAGIQLTKSTNGTTHRPDGTWIHDCLFTGGKFGIVWNGGGTYVTIEGNKFDLIQTASGSALAVIASGNQIPGMTNIIGNTFAENRNHIDLNVGGVTRGMNSGLIHGNVFQHKGQGIDVTVAIDIRGGGGNMVSGNYIGAAKSVGTGGATYEIGNDDRSAGNHFLDGEQAADLAST